MTSKERRLIRKWKKQNPRKAEGLSKQEILEIITGGETSIKVKGSKKKRHREEDHSIDIPENPLHKKITFDIREEREIPIGSRCWVCGEEVEEDNRATGIIVHIGGDRFYHKRGCGPNTRQWVLGHPDLLALLVYVDANRDRNGGGVEKLREFKQTFYPGTIMAWTADQVIHYLAWEKAGYPLAYNVDRKSYMGPRLIEEGTDPADVEDIEIYREDRPRKRKKKTKYEEDYIMAKKGKEVEETKKDKGKKAEPAQEEKKSGRGSGLIPKEPVAVPKELFKHPKIGKLLKEMVNSDDDARKREIRRMLRAEGFKLSDEATWKKFLKEAAKGKVDDDEEEEEAPKKKAGKKDKGKDKKKGKKFEEPEDDDEEEEVDDEEEDDEEEDDEEEEEKPAKKGKKGKK